MIAEAVRAAKGHDSAYADEPDADLEKRVVALENARRAVEEVGAAPTLGRVEASSK